MVFSGHLPRDDATVGFAFCKCIFYDSYWFVGLV